MTDKKYEAYEKAVRQVWLDGAVSLDEADMIEALRKSLNITLEEHAEIELKIRREIDSARSAGGSPKPDSEPPPEVQSENGEANLPSDSASPDEDVPGEPPSIGDLSSDDLAKDLDDLTKSIDRLGHRLGAASSGDFPSFLKKEEKDDSKDSMEDASSKLASISERMQQESPGEEEKGPDEGESPPGESDLLGQLKQQYELDNKENTSRVKDILGTEDESKLTETDAEDTADMQKSEESTEAPQPIPIQDEAGPEQPPSTGADEDDTDEEEDLVTSEDFLNAGKAAFRNKDFPNAVKHYKSALEIDSENREVKFFLKKAVTALKESKDQAPVEETAPKPKKKKKKKKLKTKVEDIHEDELTEISTEETTEETTEEPPAEAETSVLPEPEVSSEEHVIETGSEVQEVSEGASGSDPSCSSCGGTGTCNWCKGAQKCYWCNGSGKCTKCQGSKEIDGEPCQFCSGEGICGSCEGTGNCTWCKGTGKCNSCS